ncbi:M81 family metallopeptidase [Paenibacillus sp. J5C_2022]|uniref:M81 family metallopeptidase n=1 Tax=Paenibacillus sp. J5C2022 TaxID=2977129 RepID=UPI0021D097B4|nr:M81 family metallopeptidase [Paenibacillus sp. J5C2022]MCU6709851.1 M81 family metallopeptidase [Paenibacillus sp. J5C2022]
MLVGGISQESNTFSPSPSTMDDFRSQLFVQGEELEKMNVANEINGFYQAAREEGVTCIPTLFGHAVSSGVFKREALQELKLLLEDHLRKAGDYDGVFFAFHGAMVAEGCDDVEGELLGVIRSVIGKDVPLVISLDLHANVTRRMIQQVNGLIGFRTFPHIDFVQTGSRAAKLLFSIMRRGVAPAVAMVKVPMIVPAENGQTMHGPFAELWREAVKGEQSGDAIATSLFPVQPWLDIQEMGFASVVVGADECSAQKEAERLADLAWQLREQFDVQLYSVEEAVALALSCPSGAPVVVSDSADSPGAGSTGDSNAVLKRLLDMGMEHTLTCLMTMVDAPAVDKAIASGVGTAIKLSLGYSVHTSGGEPLFVEGTVRRIGDGKFRFGQGYAENTVGDMGRCVVFQVGTITVLLSEKPTFTGDPAMYRSMGLEPLVYDMVMVKSANQFRAEYEKLSDRIYILDTPGSSTANLLSLPYNRIERPMYPFEQTFHWSSAESGSKGKAGK